MGQMPSGWVSEEAGWWVNDALGGVCREADRKWYGYPKHKPESERIGPFDTGFAAVQAVEAQADL